MLLFSAFGTPAYAITITPITPIQPIIPPLISPEYDFTVANGAVTITKYKGTAAKVEIPSKLGGSPVKVIGISAFSSNAMLTDVIIPEGVTTLKDMSFYNCSNLVNVTLPSTLTAMEGESFALCSKLTSMTDCTILDEIETDLNRYHKLYDALRIVDPASKVVIAHSGKIVDGSENTGCAYWEDHSLKDSPIAMRAFQENECFIELKHVADAAFLISAIPIETSRGKLVLELLKDVTNSLLIGPYDNSDPINNLAFKDELTNLFNRRYVDERLPEDIIKAFTEQLPMSLVFLDVDNLKEINDLLGHAFGDKVLKEVSEIIMRSIRSDTDWVARYGGDEFLICLNNTEAKEAFEIAERIRNKIAELVILENKKVKTTASLGIYSMGQEEMTAAKVISFADHKMYEAKRNGKNCTMQ